MTDRPGEMDERDVDARFASIVAAWDGPLPTVTEGGTEPGDHGSTPGADGDATGEHGARGDHGDRPVTSDPPAAPERPPWVNPSPLEIVLPASTWRAPTTPTDPGAPPAGGTAGTAGDDDAGDPGDHFEPPPVSLPPQEDLHFWGAVAGLVAGPLLLLYVAMARPFHSDRWFLGGVLLSLTGFGLLVLRQPRHRDPTDGDDGARV